MPLTTLHSDHILTLRFQFGHVQQVQIDEGNKDGVVYIKFESVMSALNVSLNFPVPKQVHTNAEM